jgi:chromosome segregation ATPase
MQFMDSISNRFSKWLSDTPLGENPEEVLGTQENNEANSSVLDVGENLGSITSAAREQALQLRSEHAKASSSWSLELEVLANRLAILQPLVEKTLQTESQREKQLSAALSQLDERSKALSELQQELDHYRPLAASLDAELRAAKQATHESTRHLADIEAQHFQLQGRTNDLHQKLATTEALRQRAHEEKSAQAQKLRDNDVTIQTLLRENARLQSERLLAESKSEQADQQAKTLLQKLGTHVDTGARQKSTISALELHLAASEKQHREKIEELEARELHAVNALADKSKQAYDMEVKLGALVSKIEFLTRLNDNLREDLRRSIDHTANIEASNRQLLASLSSKGDEDADDTAERQNRQKLRVVGDAE